MYLFNFYISISFTYTQIWSNISPPNPSGPVWKLPGSPRESRCAPVGPRAVHDLLHRKSGWLNETKGGSRWGQNHGTWNHLHYLGVHGSGSYLVRKLVDKFITYFRGRIQPTYIGVIIHLLSSMDIPVLLMVQKSCTTKDDHYPIIYRVFFTNIGCNFKYGWSTYPHPKRTLPEIVV